MSDIDQNRGRVVLVSANRAFGVVKTSAGLYSIIEFMGNDPEPGDVLFGPLESLGGIEIINETQGGFKAFVYVQDITASMNDAKRKVLSWSR